MLKMHSITILILALFPLIYSFPQYSEEEKDYRRQYEEPEPQNYEEDPQPQPQTQKRISLIPERSTRPAVKVYKIAQPQQPAQPQVEQYNRPAEDRYNAPIRPAEEKYSTPIPIIKFDKTQSLDGSYKTSYETGNNIVAEEAGFIKNIGVKDQEALVQSGSYSYTAPDGTIISTSYTADEGGFRVEGSHLPTPPPIPEEIRKALETIYEGIKQQQEAEARDVKYGKTRPGSVEETNSISDNYPSYS